MLYRPNPRFPWAVHADTDINTLGGDTGNGYARATANNINLGDFCLAWRKSPVGITPSGDLFSGWRVFPNPASDHVTVEAPRAARRIGTTIVVQDMQGRVLHERPLHSIRTKLELGGITPQEVFITARIPGEGSIAIGRVTIVP